MLRFLHTPPQLSIYCVRLFTKKTPQLSLVAGRTSKHNLKPTPGFCSSGGGSDDGSMQRQANPYKSWEHLNHKWLMLMCVGCLAGGIAAGQVVDIDKNALLPPFSKELVMADIAKTFEFRPDLAATSIRVAFLLAARRAGLVAENFEESCAVVSGLEDISGVLRHIVTMHRLSTEDAASLMAVAAIKFLKGPFDVIDGAWRWGRKDTDDAAPRKKQLVDNSSGHIPLSAILEGLGGLTDAECVALMACHSVGEFHEHVSGLGDASHIGSRYRLSNEYYKFLLANEKRFFDLEVARTEDNKGIERLPKNFVCTYAYTDKKNKKRQCVLSRREVDAILHNNAWRKLAEQYAEDHTAWAAAFQSAFNKMINSHFGSLHLFCEPTK